MGASKLDQLQKLRTFRNDQHHATRPVPEHNTTLPQEPPTNQPEPKPQQSLYIYKQTHIVPNKTFTNVTTTRPRFIFSINLQQHVSPKQSRSLYSTRVLPRNNLHDCDLYCKSTKKHFAVRNRVTLTTCRGTVPSHDRHLSLHSTTSLSHLKGILGITIILFFFLLFSLSISTKKLFFFILPIFFFLPNCIRLS